ncbi:hypothetical protein GCM10010460_30090 [Microbacterium terrae]|nr:hypothetical protein GCM10017594_29890 [Microbacterium terrae]
MITITGNVATEPEQKRLPNGVALTTFRLASGRRRLDRETGAWVDSGTNWYRVSVFRRLGDHAFASLRKGERVLVLGRLKVREWDNGVKSGTDVEIEADALGHDLLFGTSSFSKTANAGSSGERGESEWAAPGVEAAQGIDDDPASWSVAALGAAAADDGIADGDDGEADADSPTGRDSVMASSGSIGSVLQDTPF